MSPKLAIYDFLIDPCTGTGNFIVNLVRRISGATLEHKYAEDLFANEIMLLPYYIASLNIEHAHYERTGQYRAFEGMCLVDTLEMADRVAHKGLAEQSLWMTERNAERVEREKAAPIMVVIGNPPYNVGQENENDQNKNRRYPVIDGRIRDTYVKDSQATLHTKSYNAYIKFLRWATDRLQGHDGIVCFVTDNSFVHKFALDGLRKHLLQDFTHVYHLDLHGDVRDNPRLSGTTHNVFGIQVGVGITIAIRNAATSQSILSYHRVPEMWRKGEKLSFLVDQGSIASVKWQDNQPVDRTTWIAEGLRPEFRQFLPVGAKEAKVANSSDVHAIFRTFCLGVSTNRDRIAYDFQADVLAKKAEQFIEDYNAELSRWQRAGMPTDVDAFVRYDTIKWSEMLKAKLRRERRGQFEYPHIRRSLYRPFAVRHLYYDRLMIDAYALFPTIFPVPVTEAENAVMCVPGAGDRKGFGSLVSRYIPNLDLAFEKVQCFPLYSYAEDGSNRQDNITDWALGQFQTAYGSGITKRAIFAYVYGILHHPQYVERYAENLKRELPRIPLLPGRPDFETCARIGEALMNLHLGYEEVEEYPLQHIETPAVPVNWRVQKMKLAPDRSAVIYNEWLTLAGVPPECFEYRLGNRSALDWVIDQYQVSTDARSGITSDPNRPDDPDYIVRLIKQVVTVSVETVRLVRELAAAVSLDGGIGATLEERQVGAPGD